MGWGQSLPKMGRGLSQDPYQTCSLGQCVIEGVGVSCILSQSAFQLYTLSVSFRLHLSSM